MTFVYVVSRDHPESLDFEFVAAASAASDGATPQAVVDVNDNLKHFKLTSEAAPCPLQPCYFAKWDILADTSDYQYVMGFPVCLCNHFLPIFPISCHLLMLE